MLAKVGRGGCCGSRSADDQRIPRVSMTGRTELVALIQPAQTDATNHVAVQMSIVQQPGQLIDAVLDGDPSDLDGLELVGQCRIPLTGRVSVSTVGLAGTQHGHAGSLIDGRQDRAGGIERDGGDGGGVGQLDDGQVDDGS